MNFIADHFAFVLRQGALALAATLAISASANDNGTLQIINNGPQDQPGDVICTIPLVTGEYNFTKMDTCPNDEAYFFKLNNAPSATVISFHDSPDCNEKLDQNFWFYIKTTKKNVTSEKLNISDVSQTPVGTILPDSNGARMEKWHYSAQVKGKLSCVTIKRSEVPD